MSGMPDFEAGQLVSAVTQLNKDVESLTRRWPSLMTAWLRKNYNLQKVREWLLALLSWLLCWAAYHLT